jgi:hypothetical protein
VGTRIEGSQRTRYLRDLHAERERESSGHEPDGDAHDALSIVAYDHDAPVATEVIDLSAEKDRQGPSAKRRARQQIREIRVVEKRSSCDARSLMTITTRKRSVI